MPQSVITMGDARAEDAPMTGLSLPVEVILARPVPRVPDEDALAGGCSYEAKLDGYRLVVVSRGRLETAVLQTRSGRTITHQFPEVAEAVRALPRGTVLDGELVIVRDGRLDFGALQQRGHLRRRITVQAEQAPASFIAFDMLARRGADIRQRPYRERRRFLLSLLEQQGPPPIQAIDATTSREEAELMVSALEHFGVEGVVAKGQTTAYRGAVRGWQKYRSAVPVDAAVIGVIGPVLRPRALMLALPGTSEPVVSAQLDQVMRARIGRAIAELPGKGPAMALGDVSYRSVPIGVTVEVMRGTTTRHARVVVTRLRDEPLAP
jgi:ATP-dependent DNA ligase